MLPCVTAIVVVEGDVSDTTYKAIPLSLSVQFMTVDDEVMEAEGMLMTGLDGMRVLTAVVAEYGLYWAYDAVE